MSRDQKLTVAQRDQIVVRLAAFEAPCEIKNSLKHELGITISHQYISRSTRRAIPGARRSGAGASSPCARRSCGKTAEVAANTRHARALGRAQGAARRERRWPTSSSM